MAERHYPHLFEPITIRGKTFKNRITASPHQAPDAFEPAGNGYMNFSPEGVRYYGAIARGGAGAVSTGHLGVDPRFALGQDRELFNFFSFHNLHGEILPRLHQLTDLIHAYGAVAQIELNHGGEKCYPLEGNRVFGPVARRLPDGRELVAMDEDEMERIAGYFADAAEIGQRGGFDAVYVHAAHGWLLGQFFSPLTNTRTDRYGGSVENRARFPRLVFQRIRERIGDGMLLQMRFSASELVAGGYTVEEAAETVNLLSDLVDAVQCSAGKVHDPLASGHLFPVQYMPHGCNAHLAGQIRERVRIPVEAVGGINHPAMAEQIIASGQADFVSMARSFVADPDWAEKARAGRAQEIRPCLRCMRCMNFSHRHSGHGLCTVNPRKGMPVLPPREGSRRRKTAVVVGGGPAGMQAALEIAAQGHSVVLYERDSKLGGKLAFADHVPFKEDVRRYRDHLIHMVERSANITLCLGEEAGPQQVTALAPDAVVLALGAEAWRPPVEGVDLPQVRLAQEAFGREDELGAHVLVVGGGSVGCELTVHLQSLGKRVTVAEMGEALLRDAQGTPDEAFFTEYFMTHDYEPDRRDLIGLAEHGRVSVRLNSTCVRITPQGAVLRGPDGAQELVEADTVVLATGQRIDQAARMAFADCAHDVIPVGDCARVGDLQNASSSGYYASLRI